jgi:hypothetical protein
MITLFEDATFFKFMWLEVVVERHDSQTIARDSKWQLPNTSQKHQYQ